jgi:hypothetical protein
MKKALNKILDQIYINSAPKGYRPANRPSTKTLELIIHHSNGDIRSALMSLQFLASSPEAKAGVLSIGAGVVEEKKKGKKRKKDDEDGEGEGNDGIKKLFARASTFDLIRLSTHLSTIILIDYHSSQLEKVHCSFFTRWGKYYTRNVNSTSFQFST